jgi:hypothetical protein
MTDKLLHGLRPLTLQYAGMIALALLESDEFRCTAEKWMDDDADQHEDWYDDKDRCTHVLTVEIEHEYGEYGSLLSSALVVRGVCAAWHRYEWGEGGVYEEIAHRYSERQQLLRRVREVMRLGDLPIKHKMWDVMPF